MPAEAVGGVSGRPVDSTSAGTAEPAPDQVLDVTVERTEPDTAVLRVSGEIDMLTTPVLQAAVDKQIAQDIRTLVIDLRPVSFLASSGLAALVEAQRTAQAAGVTLRLVGTSHAVTRPIVATGLRDVFELYGDVESAI